MPNPEKVSVTHSYTECGMYFFFHKNLLTGHPKNMVISKVSFCKKYFLIQYTPQYALRCVLVHCLRYVAINIRRLLPHMFTCLLVS